MILNDVMDEVGAQLDTITGLRVWDYPPNKITPPAAIVAYPDSIGFDETYGRGSDRITLPVLVVVGKVSDRASRKDLAVYCDGAGTSSIKAVLEAGSYTAFDTIRVTSIDFDVVTISGVDYAAALFDVDIFGQGS
ncbi:hypothetical protein [Haloechinothrix salitolerans]|uniref:Bacteriophage minor capsid protein n=1 Tax=Haloechinothrix salitolerans TaxID=926830 RepID=A0ABW2BWZ0_9PSEU